MVIVDTSVWVDHLRHSNEQLQSLLHQMEAAIHPFVIGELACGQLKSRAEILGLFKSLPSVPVVDHEHVLFFIEQHNLMAKGLGLIDIHLLASAKMSHTQLWTNDKSLRTAAEKLNISFLTTT